MISRIRPYTKYIALFLTIILVALLLTQVSSDTIISIISHINPVYLLAGFMLYASSYFFRAWRFHLLLNREVSIKDLFNIVCVHNATNNLLPARTGELSYIYLLKKINNKTVGDGIATLVVSRIFDFIALIILFFFAIVLITDIPKIIMDALWIIAFFGIFLLIVLVILLTRGKKFVIQIQKTAERLHCEHNPGVHFFIRKGFETIESLDRIQIKESISALMISPPF